ncbi:MAG: hypothetical protein IT372_10225 [Polyangiaceae bacterium]|nr:hypothetical protein [Polyangiaceae bacterium]
MRNLPPPTSDPHALYDGIIQRKEDASQRERLLALRDAVRRAYEEYDREKPRLERVRPLAAKLTQEQRKDLLDCYNSPTDPLKRVRADIFRACPDKCQYCTIVDVAHLDHYLPKKDFPEFAVLPINLVPSCGICNSPRSWTSTAGKRALIHLYFDPVPDVRLLFAEVQLVGGVPQAKFRVEVSGCLDGLFADLYLEHVRTLDLLARYETKATLGEEGIDSIRQEVVVHCPDLDADRVRAKLFDMARLRQQALGSNHWKVALYFGLAESKDSVIQWLRGSSCV